VNDPERRLLVVTQIVERPERPEHVDEHAQRRVEREPTTLPRDVRPDRREPRAVHVGAHDDEVVPSGAELANARKIRVDERRDAGRLTDELHPIRRRGDARVLFDDEELRLATLGCEPGKEE